MLFLCVSDHKLDITEPILKNTEELSSVQNSQVNTAVQVEQKIEEKPKYKIKLSKSDKELLRRLDMEHRAKLSKQAEEKSKEEKEMEKPKATSSEQAKIVSVPNPKSKQKVNI